MTIIDQFEQILSGFNKVEEPLFLRDIREFAEGNREVVCRTFAVLLRSKDLNIQLKYLILKSMGELKYPECVPAIRDLLYVEEKIQIIYVAVDALAVNGSFSAYKIIVDFLEKHKNAEFAEKIERSLRDIFIKSPLSFHFDVFYRDRGHVANIEKSSEYLINHLSDEFISEMLPSLFSQFYKIKYEAVRILKKRPNPGFYASIYNCFMEHIQKADDSLFLMISEALITCACLSRAKMKIFQKLQEIVPQLEPERKKIFCICLFKMSNNELLHYITAIYPELSFDHKMLVFNNLNADEYIYYGDFIKLLLTTESNEVILPRVVEILIRAKEFKYLFNTLNTQNGIRKLKILNMILDHQPAEIDNYIHRYVSPNQDNQVLLLSLEYLMKNAADRYFNLIKSIFFTGVTPEIKVLIIRNVNKWNHTHRKIFMETIFKDLSIIYSLRKDFLLSLLGLMNDKIFDEAYEDFVMNRLLVLMEESPLDEIVNFIYFFDKYTPKNEPIRNLIIEELRLIQNTLLKSGSDQNLVKMIHILIKNIEKKATFKKGGGSAGQ